MGFFDKIRSGRLFFGKKTPSMVVQFTVKGQKYIVEEFDMDFAQDVNHKGQPDSMPHGGLLTVTISEAPDKIINEWMVDSYLKYDGEFRFLMNDGMIREGAVLQIQFKDAYCVNYRKTLNPQGAGTLTTLVISPRYLRVGNEVFEKKWN
jgi:hypothetical protein